MEDFMTVKKTHVCIMCNNAYFYVTDTIVKTTVVLELPLCGSHLVKSYS